MTRQRALQILIEHAARDCVGAGCGYHTVPSEERRMEVSRAVRKLWRNAYDWPITDTDFLNLGIPIPPEE
jgi:hypothetical protein